MTEQTAPSRRRTAGGRVEPVAHGLRWDEECLKFEFQDFKTEGLEPGPFREFELAAESQSNQEDSTSIPDDGFEPERERKRLRGDLRSKSELALSPSGDRPGKESRRAARSSSARKFARSPRDVSGDSGGDSRGLRPSSRQKGFYAEQFDKPDPITAAKNKASRERLRRERLNESFVDLTKALDPEKYFRAEKTTIIADTIKMLNSMRLENEQLREERKALRERINESEREKETLLFQQSLLKQELETAQAANYSQQHSRSYQHSGPVVAMGVPLNPRDLHSQNVGSGGLSQLIQSTTQPHTPQQSGLQPPSLQARPLQQHSPLTEGEHGMSDAYVHMLPSPPDFLDLDLTHEMAALATASLPPRSGSPTQWLGSVATTGL